MLQWARYQEEVFTATGAVPTKCWWEVFCANGYLHKGDETKGLLRLSGISAVFTRYPQELWANSSWVNYHNHSSSYPTCNHKGIQSLPCLPLATCSTAGFCLAVTVPCPEMGLFLWHSKQFQWKSGYPTWDSAQIQNPICCDMEGRGSPVVSWPWGTRNQFSGKKISRGSCSSLISCSAAAPGHISWQVMSYKSAAQQEKKRGIWEAPQQNQWALDFSLHPCREQVRWET